MKKSSRTILVLIWAVLCINCKQKEVVSPVLSAAQTKMAVVGKWKITKVDYKVCRNGSCSITSYSGLAQDYFEFRPDSAFLSYTTAASYQQLDAFKAEYKLSGAFILTHGFWSARYDVKECKDGKLILECSYAGSDPYALFTDTYYLYR